VERRKMVAEFLKKELGEDHTVKCLFE